MKYRVTPFNIGALVMAGLIARYFILFDKQPVLDAPGVNAAFGLVPLVILGIVLLIADIGIQGSRNTRGFKIILLVEVYGVILLLLLLWACGIFQFIFPTY